MVKRETELLPSPVQNGGVAQLGEHLPCKQGVRSSILLVSTIKMFFENYTEETNEINQPLKRESKLTTF